MDALLDILIILGLFVLRIGVPLGITIVLIYFLRKLDTRWQAEADREHTLDILMDAAAKGLLPEPPVCWETMGCPVDSIEKCPAFLDRDAYCWELMGSDGEIADICLTCSVLKSSLPEAVIIAR